MCLCSDETCMYSVGMCARVSMCGGQPVLSFFPSNPRVHDLVLPFVWRAVRVPLASPAEDGGESGSVKWW